MDHSKWTPIKKMSIDDINMQSPVYKTPVRPSERELRRTALQGSANRFSVLPNHITPPSGLTKFIARNPFEADITSKLHISVISPSVFTKLPTPAQESPGFKWTVEELALLQPAKIEEFPNQQMHCSDPEIEKTAQEAITRFFSENQIFPSPCDIKIKKNNVLRELPLHTPIRSFEDTNSTKECSKLKKDSYAQTVLSLPPELPPNVEEALKPYFTFTQDQNVDTEDANTSNNSSLRRKLFFNNDDTEEENSFDSVQISPAKSPEPRILNCSPLQSGMFCHGTPVGSSTGIMKRHFGSPLGYAGAISPCDVSPIYDRTNMSCQSIKSRNRTRLDFTKDMSIDVSAIEKDDKKMLCKTLFMEEIKSIEQEPAMKIARSDQTLIKSPKRLNRFECEDKENVQSEQSINKSKLMDFCKTHFSESYVMHSNMMSGNFDQKSAFSLTQDTGYISCTSNNIVDDSVSMIKKAVHWRDGMPLIDDDLKLSEWNENMISSTPSKYK